MLKKFSKILIHSLWIVAALAMAVTFSLSSNFAYTRPTTPDKLSGRTFTHIYHGRTVYLTKTEAYELYGAESVLFLAGSGFIAAVTAIYGLRK